MVHPFKCLILGKHKRNALNESKCTVQEESSEQTEIKSCCCHIKQVGDWIAQVKLSAMLQRKSHCRSWYGNRKDKES